MHRKTKMFFEVAAVLVLMSSLHMLIKKRTEKNKTLEVKHLNDFHLMHRWLQIYQEGKNLAEYLENMGCKKIAVYGMGLAGERLLDEIRGTDIQILYGIDKRAHKFNGEIEVYSLYDELPEVDAVIVTVPMYFDSIKLELEKITDSKIISLEDILYDI